MCYLRYTTAVISDQLCVWVGVVLSCVMNKICAASVILIFLYRFVQVELYAAESGSNSLTNGPLHRLHRRVTIGNHTSVVDTRCTAQGSHLSDSIFSVEPGYEYIVHSTYLPPVVADISRRLVRPSRRGENSQRPPSPVCPSRCCPRCCKPCSHNAAVHDVPDCSLYLQVQGCC